MTEATKAWRTFWIASAVVFMVSLDATVVVAAFPAMRAHFATASAAVLSWTLNGYTIVFASLLVPMGRMVDQLGRRRCFLLGVAGFTAASAWCAFALTPQALISARVVQATAAAVLSPATLALILASFPSEERERVAGLWSAVGALGAAVGPAIGSALIQWWSWRMIFLINLPLGLAVLWLGSRLLEESRVNTNSEGFDARGTALLIASVAMIASGLTQVESFMWSSSHVWLPLAGGLVLLGMFVAWAYGREDAALDLRLFANRNYRWASAGSLALGTGFGMMFLSFYLFFIGVWHYPQAHAGLAAMPGPLIATLGTMVVSTKMKVWSRKMLLIGGGLLYAVSNLWLTLRISSTPAHYGVWLPGQVVGGIAVGMMLPSLAGAAVDSLQKSSLGVGSAVNNAVRQLGSSLGVALSVGIAGGATVRVENFRVVYLTLAGIGFLIALLALPMEDRPDQAST